LYRRWLVFGQFDIFVFQQAHDVPQASYSPAVTKSKVLPDTKSAEA
jgi:hypothetical protein